VDLVTVSIQVFFILAFCVAVVIVFAMVGRRSRGRKTSSTADFRCFSPAELDRLKDKGLLTESEAKKVQAVLAERTLEEMEKKKAPMKEAADLNSLLAEAERLKRESLRAEFPPSDEEKA
jgi:cytochrome c-type biogenesis protein CcmH/NrfG